MAIGRATQEQLPRLRIGVFGVKLSHPATTPTSFHGVIQIQGKRGLSPYYYDGWRMRIGCEGNIFAGSAARTNVSLVADSLRFLMLKYFGQISLSRQNSTTLISLLACWSINAHHCSGVLRFMVAPKNENGKAIYLV